MNHLSNNSINSTPLQIYIFIGLPGSGKTHRAMDLCKKLGDNVLYIDDLYMELQKNSFNWQHVFYKRDNLVLDNLVITDFLACDPKQQMFLYNKINTVFPFSQQHWTFFNNNPEQCLKNIQLRNNGLNVTITLQQMTKIYAISQDLKEHVTSLNTLPVYGMPMPKKNKSIIK